MERHDPDMDRDFVRTAFVYNRNGASQSNQALRCAAQRSEVGDDGMESWVACATLDEVMDDTGFILRLVGARLTLEEGDWVSHRAWIAKETEHCTYDAGPNMLWNLERDWCLWGTRHTGL